MKKQLNEVKRMQQLAGLIKESYINEEDQEPTPEEAASKVSKIVGSLEKSSTIDKIVSDIEKDPKAMKELEALLNKSGINPNQLSETMDSTVQKLALTMAKKAEDTPINEEEGFDYGGAFFTGLFGGGALAYKLASLSDVITPHMKLMGYSPSHMVETVVGAIVGAALAVIAKKIYDSRQ
jgi:hypothetical protein